MTCGEYGQLKYSDQVSAVSDPIRAHDLDPSSNALAAASVVTEVNNFCGVSAVAPTGSASMNLDSPMDNAVDWAAYSD